MNKRIAKTLSVVVTLVVSGCVREITSDERLERETARSDSMKTATAGELSKLHCDDINSELMKARDEARSEEARLNSYVDLYERVKSRTQKFDEALSHNPDLAYQEGSANIVGAREGCVQSQADVRLDFEGLVREIMQMPTVDEIRNGSTVKVTRLSFDALRTAIEKLDLDDKEALLAKLNNAEKQVDLKDAKRKREK
jgi:hypothetical protein